MNATEIKKIIKDLTGTCTVLVPYRGERENLYYRTVVLVFFRFCCIETSVFFKQTNKNQILVFV